MRMQAPTMAGLIARAMEVTSLSTVQMAERLGTTKQAVGLARRKCAKLATVIRYLRAATGVDYGIVSTSAGFIAVPDAELATLFASEAA